jgi:phospholipid-transporting ATPase
VEDRLQDDVPQTIASLQEAGIKIWMLTGDKLETAENIAESCRLLIPSMRIHKISNDDELELFCSDEMIELNHERIKQGEKWGILLEAGPLQSMLDLDFLKVNFLQISKTCEAVVCCRVSPNQKAEVVGLIKDDDDETVTLAIGDGANDVSMIRRAHIGIGLYGNEGMNAV